MRILSCDLISQYRLKHGSHVRTIGREILTLFTSVITLWANVQAILTEIVFSLGNPIEEKEDQKVAALGLSHAESSQAWSRQAFAIRKSDPSL
jgi:hypothetical protein